MTGVIFTSIITFIILGGGGIILHITRSFFIRNQTKTIAVNVSIFFEILRQKFLNKFFNWEVANRQERKKDNKVFFEKE